MNSFSRSNQPHIRFELPPLPDDQSQEEIRNLKKRIKIDLLTNIALGSLILLVSVGVFAQSFGLFKNLKTPLKKTESQKVFTDSLDITHPALKVASAKENSPLFISQQTLDINKAFKAPPSNLQLTVTGQLKKTVFGFLPYWVAPKLDDLNTTLLTDVSYFGLEVDRNGEIIKEDSDPWENFSSNNDFDDFFKKLKKNRIRVHVTLKCFNQSNIEQLVTSEKARESFINNALYLMQSKSLDGINLDFEYIGTPSKEVTDGFSILVTDLNKTLKREYPKAQVTVDTFVDAASNTRIHDIPILAENSDALIIMGYDFHTPRSSKAGPVTPMEGYGNSLVGLMSSYLEKAPAEKLVLAVPYYGYDWPVVERSQNAEVVSGQVKIISYAELAEASKDSQINWDENAQTPWYGYIDPLTRQPRVVHFENARSLSIKYDYINNKNLKGMGIWAMGFDGQRVELEQVLADKFANQ